MVAARSIEVQDFGSRFFWMQQVACSPRVYMYMCMYLSKNKKSNIDRIEQHKRQTAKRPEWAPEAGAAIVGSWRGVEVHHRYTKYTWGPRLLRFVFCG
jgi:hypothetical protein